MSKTKVLSETKYAKLVRDVRRLIEEGKTRATRAAQHELVQAYWQVGKRISDEGILENSSYGESIIEDISEELNIDVRTLQRSVVFLRAYKTATSSRNLSWSHYKYLLTLNDDKERTFYEELAQEEGLNVLALAHSIKEDRYGNLQERSAPSKGVSIKRPSEPTYIYKAFVDRVIDGDTILLRIDLGFQVLKEQRVRLAQIDCEPIDSAKGREAFRFVRDTLGKVEFVMVKTHKIDVYGRYIGDIFYSLKDASKVNIFKSGSYLNQVLLDRGLARVL